MCQPRILYPAEMFFKSESTIKTHPTGNKKITRKYYEQPKARKLDKWNEMRKFLGKQTDQN